MGSATRRKSGFAQINLFDEIFVDNFAGGGGASTGIELATGRPVDIAINHDPDAIAMHSKNHPYTTHYCESVWEVNPVKACKGQKVALAWFSPDCKHFSKAKGGKPVSKNIRGLAWIVLKWAALVRPRVIILENVEEFQTWGPIKRGRPVKSRKGETFAKWKGQLEALGYAVEHKELKACDYGAPTIRKRFFLVARCDGQPIVFPQPTHGDPNSLEVKDGKLLPWRTAAECIDFTLPCKSIFERPKPLADNTMARIAKGADKFVINNPEPFIVQVNHGGGFRGQGLDEPLQTVTAKHGYGVVDPFLVPIGYGERKGQTPRVNDICDPLGTIVSSGKHYLCSPSLAPYVMYNNANNMPGDVEEPLRTIATGNRCFLAMPSLIQYHSERTKSEVRGQPVGNPFLTVDTQPRYAVNMPFLSKYFGGVVGVDVGQPLPTVTAIDHNALAAVNLVEYYSTGRALDVNTPMHTLTTKDRQALVESHLCVLRNHMDCKPWQQPLSTLTAATGHMAEVRTYLTKVNSDMQLGYWPQVRELLNKHCGYALAEDELLLFWIKGCWYFICDIGLRMLEPRELYNAQGFPFDYIIDFEVNGKRYSKAAQVARCGNSVCPALAEALTRANLPEYCIEKITTMAELAERMVV